QVLVRGLLHRAGAGAAAGGTGGLHEAVIPREDFHLPLMTGSRTSAGDAVHLDVCVNGHDLFSSSVHVRSHAAAGGGSSATSRMEVVSSSSWKCGRRNATARNAPGLPGMSY